MGKKSRLKRERNKEQEQGGGTSNFMIIGIIAILIIAVGGFVGYKILHKTSTSNDNATKKEQAMQTSNAMITTNMGVIKLQLFNSAAPKTVENFKKLVGQGFYNGTRFHRVIPDFMIQGGDPNSSDDSKADLWGTGGPSYTFDDEINPWSLGLDNELIANYEKQGYKYSRDLTSYKMEKGVIAMANSGPNTNGSQFFIVTTQDQPYLNGKHTVFGKVTEGLDVADKISRVERDSRDRPLEPVTIEKIEITD